MKIGEAYRKADTFGLFQKFAMVILAFSGGFHGMQTSSNNFISGQPERWCKIDNLMNFSFEQQKYIAIPQNTEGAYDTCQAFALDWANFTTEDFVYWNRSAFDGQTDRVPCDDYVYSEEVFLETANSKWNLVCSNSIVGEMISTIFVVGLFVGSVSSGRVSDSLGRRTSEIGFCTLLMVSLYAAAFVPHPIAFLVLRFVVGFSMRGNNMSASVLILELSGKNSREFAGVLVPGFFSIGVMICSGCAFLLRDFQLLHIVMGGIATCILLTMAIIPESPRWLLVNGKVEKAKKTMKWISEVNNSPLPDDFTLEQQETQATQEKLSYSDLYRHPVLRKHILIIHFLWVAANFSHMAMTLNLGALTGNAYLNVFLSGATELPACIAVMFSMRSLGRTKTFFIFGSVFAICNAIAIPFELFPDLRIAASIFTILARAAASALLCNMRVMTAELFPTPLRQRVLGACTGLAAAFGISGPYLGGPLRGVWRPLPNVIFGSFGAAAVLLSLLLPDTMGLPLPETMEEAATISKRKSRSPTSKFVPSVSITVDKKQENGLNATPNVLNGTPNGLNGMPNILNGTQNGFVTKPQLDDEDSVDDGIFIFHF